MEIRSYMEFLYGNQFGFPSFQLLGTLVASCHKHLYGVISLNVHIPNSKNAERVEGFLQNLPSAVANGLRLNGRGGEQSWRTWQPHGRNCCCQVSKPEPCAGAKSPAPAGGMAGGGCQPGLPVDWHCKVSETLQREGTKC